MTESRYTDETLLTCVNCHWIGKAKDCYPECYVQGDDISCPECGSSSLIQIDDGGMPVGKEPILPVKPVDGKHPITREPVPA